MPDTNRTKDLEHGKKFASGQRAGFPLRQSVAKHGNSNRWQLRRTEKNSEEYTGKDTIDLEQGRWVLMIGKIRSSCVFAQIIR